MYAAWASGLWQVAISFWWISGTILNDLQEASCVAKCKILAKTLILCIWKKSIFFGPKKGIKLEFLPKFFISYHTVEALNLLSLFFTPGFTFNPFSTFFSMEGSFMMIREKSLRCVIKTEAEVGKWRKGEFLINLRRWELKY